MKIRLRPEAGRDLRDAARWYESQEPGLGNRFLDEVSRTFQFISDSPYLYPEVHAGVRRAVLRRFPYGIFYVIDEETAVVLAVVHASRDPEIWPDRP